LLDTVEKIASKKLNIVEAPRRAGDPPTLIAQALRVRSVLGWQPKHDNLESIVGTQLAWEKRLLAEPKLLHNG
jgi:UDP-glucose 4-epimerase